MQQFEYLNMTLTSGEVSWCTFIFVNGIHIAVKVDQSMYKIQTSKFHGMVKR
jgi:hypothetical protein